MVDVVIFDLDGTLIDTAAMTTPALAELCPGYGLEPPGRQAVLGVMGLHDSEFYCALFPDAPQAVRDALAMAVERREGEIGRRIGRGILFPGVTDMLARLYARGIGIYIASTGSASHLRDMLAIAGIGGCVRGVYCDEPDKRAMVRRIIEASGARNAVYVGDMEKDITAGRANGLPVIGAGFGYVKERDRALFDAVADTPEALEALLLDSGGGGWT